MGRKLFEPLKIGSIEVKNRIGSAPTQMLFCAEDGSLTDQNLCYYVAKAKGGVGLIIIEGTLVSNKYSNVVGAVGIYKDTQAKEFKELADAIHAFGVAAIVQLTIGFGGQTLFNLDGKDLVAPSPIPSRLDNCPSFLKSYEGLVGQTPRSLTVEEIVQLEDSFVASAQRVRKAGFEGIEIHGPHGYLLAEFLSPLSNQRQDAYGGSFEKRLTLSLNLIRKTREALGKDFVIGYRISGDEHVEGGLTIEDTIRIVLELEKAGLDYIHLSSGRYEAFNHFIPDREGVMIEESKAIKKEVNIPVLCPNIHTPQLAEKVLDEGMADMVVLGRALLADPQWPNKVKEGALDKIRHCIFDGVCLHHIFNGFSVRCSVNPDLGRERFIPECYPPPRKK